jgi:NAD/NADP transhydrogenase beta subunit
MQVQAGGVMQYAIPAAIIVAVFALRLRRMSQVRTLQLERLWIVPALYAVVCVVLLVEFPPTPLGWLWCVLALAAGGALGWQRGKTMRITVDPETHQLNQKASLAGMAFLLVLIAIRTGARAEGQAMHLDLRMVTVALAVFALGLFAVQRVEMYTRARRLLAAARAG